MATAVIFDTLRYAKRLEEAGVPTRQAEVQAEAIAEVISGEIATMRDLKEMETTLRRDLKEAELRLEGKLAETKADLLKWMAGMLVAQTGLIAALVKLS